MSTLAANDDLPPDAAAGQPSGNADNRTLIAILAGISGSHFINDFLQAVPVALYPLFRESFSLTFAQIGLITFIFHIVSSVFQPLIGYLTDRRPQPYLMLGGFLLVMCGLTLMALATGFRDILLGAGLMGCGSAIFHPEASRIAHLASGGRYGLAQSVFQLGGNAGTAFSPLLAVLVIRLPQIGWFVVAGVIAMTLPAWIGRWYRAHLADLRARPRRKPAFEPHNLSRKRIVGAIIVLLALIFSKYIYITSINSFYMFYLMENFGISVKNAQLHLFAFAFAIALGTLIGGPIGDRYGRRLVIWVSILGAAPFSLLLPHVGLWGVGVLSVCIGLILSSAFSAILVYAQALLPGNIGMVSGLFFGFAFGMAGAGSAVLGKLADAVGINTIFTWCAFLPLIGLLTTLLPDVERKKPRA